MDLGFTASRIPSLYMELVVGYQDQEDDPPQYGDTPDNQIHEVTQMVEDRSKYPLPFVKTERRSWIWVVMTESCSGMTKCHQVRTKCDQMRTKCDQVRTQWN